MADDEQRELFDGSFIDKKKMWEVPQYSEGELKRSIVDETSFATIFPKYLETYLQKIWPDVELVLKKYQCKGELNLTEGSMTVRTSKKSWDPYAIINARDFIKLLGRSVPLQQASKIFQDEMSMEIIKIGSFVRNKERFVKRRQRLLGPEGKTLKALELLTDCYILVQGKTVAAMGGYKGLKAVKQIVEDCMQNVHPIYGLKRLLIRRELSKDDKMKNENWSRMLPSFKKQNLKRAKRKHIRRTTKLESVSPFPPAPAPRKEDIAMETGEYFLNKKRKEKSDGEGTQPAHKKAKTEKAKKEKKEKKSKG